jgi:hypothetical protein
MCPRCEGIVAIYDPPRLYFIARTCKQWGCPYCGKVLTRKLRRMFERGAPTALLTLTCNPALGNSPLERRKLMGQQFKRLIERTKRHCGVKRLPYKVSVEATKAGEPHFHVGLRAPFIDQAWLADQWEQLTGARIVDIRAIRHVQGAARYVSKYLTKAPAKYATLPRTWQSRDWEIKDTEQPNKQRLHGEKRVLMGSSLAMVIKLLQEDGWSIGRSSHGYIEATREDGVHDPPLWECMTPLAEIERPRRGHRPTGPVEITHG